MTTYNVPALGDTADKCSLAVAAVCQPFAHIGLEEETISTVDFGPDGPLRCDNCRGYINCNVKWSNGGKNWICNLCHVKNEVPQWYRCNLDGKHERRDKMDRAELHRGSVDFVAPNSLKKEMQRNPAFFFIIDVSRNAFERGLIETQIESVRESVYQLRESVKEQEANLNGNNTNNNSNQQPNKQKCNLQIGFLTYDSKIHFHSLSNGELYVVSQVSDPFVAIPNSEILFTITDEEKYYKFDQLLSRIPKLFEFEHKHNNTGGYDDKMGNDISGNSGNRNAQNKGGGGGIQGGNDDFRHGRSCFGAAMAAGVKVLTDCGGKIFAVQSSLPNIGLGKLKNRDDINIYGTPKERELYGPATSFWERLANECSYRFISVDLFVCATGYCDVASTGYSSCKTGGQHYYYPNFTKQKDGDRFFKDMCNSVLKTTVFRCIMVIRCTQGIETVDYMGPFHMTEDNEMQFACMTSDTSFATRLQHYEELSPKSKVCVQFAMCYLTMFGDVNIRIHNICCNVVSTISDVFRCVDMDAVLSVSLKQCAQEMLQPVSNTMTIEQARNSLSQACIEILYTYRRYCATNNAARQLVLPEALKLLPLFTLGLIKNPILKDGISADERSFHLSYSLMMPVYQSLTYIHPYLYPMHSLSPNECVLSDSGRVLLPRAIKLRKQDMSIDGLYVLDTGRKLLIVIGPKLNADKFNQAFVVNNDENGKLNEILLKQDYQENVDDLGYRLSLLLDELRYDKPYYLDHYIMLLPDKNNRLSINQTSFLEYLIEDASRVSAQRAHSKNQSKKLKQEPHKKSYVDFLVYIHKEIQKKFIEI